MSSAIQLLTGAFALAASSALASGQCPGDLLLTVSESGQEFLVHYARDGTLLQRSSGTPASAGYLEQGLFLPDGNWLCLSLHGFEFFDGNTGMHTHSVALPLEVFPAHLEALSNGHVLVKDLLTQAGRVYDLQGNLVTECAGLMICPAGPYWSTGVDAAGNIWIGESCGPFRLRQFDVAGNQLAEWDLLLSNSLRDIEGAPDGSLWLLNGSLPAADNYAADGTLLSSFTPLGNRSLAVDPDGSLWASGNLGSVAHHASDGALLGQFPVPNSWSVRHIAIDTNRAALGQAYCTPANTNSSGSAAMPTGFGCAQIAGNDLQLTVENLPPGQPGYFITGSTSGLVPFAGGSQGNLCLSGAIGRYNQAPFIADVAGRVEQSIDLSQVPTPTGTQALLAGQTWHWQAWYRDQNPGPTSNFSSGIALRFQ